MDGTAQIHGIRRQKDQRRTREEQVEGSRRGTGSSLVENEQKRNVQKSGFFIPSLQGLLKELKDKTAVQNLRALGHSFEQNKTSWKRNDIKTSSFLTPRWITDKFFIFRVIIVKELQQQLSFCHRLTMWRLGFYTRLQTLPAVVRYVAWALLHQHTAALSCLRLPISKAIRKENSSHESTRR